MRKDIRVLMIGDFSTPLDEGMKKSAYFLAQSMEKNVTILRFDLSNRNYISQMIKAIGFKPHIIHYLHGPTRGSFIFSKTMGLFLRARTVISAIHPVITKPDSSIIRLFKVDHIITMSEISKEEMIDYANECSVSSSGVDFDIFRPASMETKLALRRKYGFPEEGFIVFHAGPLVESRNLEWLSTLPKEGYFVVVAASKSTPPDKNISRLLENNDVHILREYQQRIEEIYQSSDCYVFPTIEKGGSIEFPLSILEGLACGIPVISMKFGAIPETLYDCPGFTSVSDLSGLKNEIVKVMNRIDRVDFDTTKEAILKYSWDNIALQISRTYEDLVISK